MMSVTQNRGWVLPCLAQLFKQLFHFILCTLLFMEDMINVYSFICLHNNSLDTLWTAPRKHIFINVHSFTGLAHILYFILYWISVTDVNDTGFRVSSSTDLFCSFKCLALYILFCELFLVDCWLSIIWAYFLQIWPTSSITWTAIHRDLQTPSV